MKPDGYVNHKSMDMLCWNIYKIQECYEHVLEHYKHTNTTECYKQVFLEHLQMHECYEHVLLEHYIKEISNIYQ